MKRFLCLLGAVLAAHAPLAAAEQAEVPPGPVLIELFASKHCPACPDAHATLKDVKAAREDVMILTWSVDYWDYLGTPDPMAMSASAERQGAYVERFGLRGAYTPQTVYDGRTQCPGNRPADVDAALGKAHAAQASHGVTVEPGETRWRVTVPARLAAEVHLVAYRADGAHDTDMVNPVTGVTRLADLPHGGTLAFTPACESGCALIVQAPGHGEVFRTVPVN